jgi:hypothetical protein
MVEGMRDSFLNNSNNGQSIIGFVDSYLHLPETTIGSFKALTSLPGRAYDAVSEKGFGTALLDGWTGSLDSLRSGFFDVAYGLNGEAKGNFLFGLASSVGSGAVLRGSGSVANSGVPINGATRTVPLGFSQEPHFLNAAQELHDVLKASGINDATIGVRGSSVTGYSLTKGTKFGPQSDIDFFVESAQLTDGYKASKNIPGFVHPNKILPDYPLLQDWATKWTNTLGRDVTPGAFVPGTLPGQPAIVVK